MKVPVTAPTNRYHPYSSSDTVLCSIVQPTIVEQSCHLIAYHRQLFPASYFKFTLGVLRLINKDTISNQFVDVVKDLNSEIVFQVIENEQVIEEFQVSASENIDGFKQKLELMKEPRLIAKQWRIQVLSQGGDHLMPMCHTGSGFGVVCMAVTLDFVPQCLACKMPVVLDEICLFCKVGHIRSLSGATRVLVAIRWICHYLNKKKGLQQGINAATKYVDGLSIKELRWVMDFLQTSGLIEVSAPSAGATDLWQPSIIGIKKGDEVLNPNSLYGVRHLPNSVHPRVRSVISALSDEELIHEFGKVFYAVTKTRIITKKE